MTAGCMQADTYTHVRAADGHWAAEALEQEVVMVHALAPAIILSAICTVLINQRPAKFAPFISRVKLPTNIFKKTAERTEMAISGLITHCFELVVEPNETR